MASDDRAGGIIAECCDRYLRHGLDLIIEWTDGIATDHAPDMAESYRTAIKDHAVLLRAVFDGQPCPWHDNGIPESYLAVMKAMGGSDGEQHTLDNPPPWINRHRHG